MSERINSSLAYRLRRGITSFAVAVGLASCNTSPVSAPSAEPEPTTKPTTNVPTAYDAGSEYEKKVAQAIRDGGDPCVDPSSILFDAGTPNMTTDDGILTICTNPTTGKDSIYNQPAGSYKVSKLDIAVDPSARTITGSVIEETETKPTETPQSSNPNDIPDNVPQSQLKLIFQADITKEQIVYSPTGEVGDAIIYNVTPSFRPDYERFTKNAGFIESPALQPSATLEPTATVAPTETPAPEFNEEVEKEKLRTLIESAPGNVQSLDYLQSPEYLQRLRDLDAQGSLPNVSDEANFLNPGSSIQFKYNNPGKDQKFFNQYGVIQAYKIGGAQTWYNLKSTPFTIADIGRVSDYEGVFITYKWQNPDGTIAFQGFTVFTPHPQYNLDKDSTFLDLAGLMLNYNFNRYRMPAFYEKTSGCLRSLKASGYTGKYDSYCQAFGKNQQFESQLDVIENWASTGILTNTESLTFMPGISGPIK